MNVFIRAMVRIFSFGERWNVLFNSAIASLNRAFHLSPHENILTIALINIHYLYNITVTILQVKWCLRPNFAFAFAILMQVITCAFK